MGGLKEGRARGGSMGCIEDLWKRKREEGEEEKEGFVKNRKTEITGGREGGWEGRGGERKKGGGEMDIKLERGNGEDDEGSRGDMHGEVGEELKTVREEVKEGREEIREALKEIKEREGRWKEERKEVRRQRKN